jgi:hypothetical protein
MTLNANALQLISIVDRLTNAKQIRLSDLEKILGFHVPFDPGRYDYKSCYFAQAMIHRRSLNP